MLFAVRVALVFAALAAATVPARAEDLNALFARMRERSGPVWRTHLTSVSHLTFSNETVDVHSESLALQFASYTCESSLCTGSYFNGERVYSININGTTLPQSASPDAFLRAERTIASLDFLSPGFAGSVEDRGNETIDGKAYHTFVVSNGDATPMNVYVDSKRAIVRYFGDVDGDQTIEYRDYRPVDGGLYLPFLVLRNGAVLERYDARGSTSDEFSPPHGPKPRFHGAPAPVATDPNRSVPVFPCTLGGVATRCLLDSGNSGLSMSLELAEALHAPSVGSFVVRGLGNYATEVVRGSDLEVGNATFPAANYVVLHDIHRFGYDVVLGADVLASTTIGLDPVHHRITFDAPVPTAGTRVSLAFQNFVPVLNVELGSLGTELALDTGDESNINLSYAFYKEHPGLFDATEQRSVAGVGGSSVELIGKIPEVRIGTIAMSAQTIGATQTLRGTAFGHLGAAFLQHFDVVFDYAAQAVHFVPTPAPTNAP